MTVQPSAWNVHHGRRPKRCPKCYEHDYCEKVDNEVLIVQLCTFLPPFQSYVTENCRPPRYSTYLQEVWLALHHVWGRIAS